VKSHQDMKEREFDVLLLEAIDEAFLSVSPSSKELIHEAIEKVGIKKPMIPKDINLFSSTLFTIFGVGAKFLEILIMKKLQEKVNLYEQWTEPVWFSPTLTFCEFVKTKRTHFLNSKKIEFCVDFGIFEECDKRAIERK
jgi:hypothetical protein